MKEKSHKSRNRDWREDDKHLKHNTDKYSNILKEKYYKEVSNSNDTKLHKIRSPNREPRNATSPERLINRRKEKNRSKSRKKEEVREDSYEELSRKKRKIESELQALDLEEAAAKKHKVKGKNSTQPVVKIKEEPVSEDRSSKARLQNPAEESNKPTSKMPKQEEVWGQDKQETKKPEKEKPNFGVSGKLAEDTNIYNGVVIKYNQPSEARKPQRRWRLYPFKGDSDLPFIPIHRQSAYLFGRTRSIADIPIDHPSCSKQHAVLQFRLVPYKREDGTTGRRVRPYIIDLESSNGTFINNKRVNPRCYVELVEKDVIKFGYSSREYVLLHEGSKQDEEDDDVRDST